MVREKKQAPQPQHRRRTWTACHLAPDIGACVAAQLAGSVLWRRDHCCIDKKLRRLLIRLITSRVTSQLGSLAVSHTGSISAASSMVHDGSPSDVMGPTVLHVAERSTGKAWRGRRNRLHSRCIDDGLGRLVIWLRRRTWTVCNLEFVLQLRSPALHSGGEIAATSTTIVDGCSSGS